MSTQTKDLWSLVLDRLEVDPGDLAEAVQEEVRQTPLDFRTRLLIRDSMEALQHCWGRKRLLAWLAECPNRHQLESIWHERLGEPGFPFLRGQIVEPTRPETIRQMLRELSTRVHHPVQLRLGGSGALILSGHLCRRTQDLDIVDELPREIRTEQKYLADLTQRYRLQLTHFQSHYLPKGWEQRVHSLEPFGTLQVFIVDVYDVFLSKLFSHRTKDRDDLRILAPQLDKEILTRRLQETTAAWLAEERVRQYAIDNWYILYGEALPA